MTATLDHPALSRLGVTADWVRSAFERRGAFIKIAPDLIGAADCPPAKRQQMRNGILAELRSGPKTTGELSEAIGATGAFVGCLVSDLRKAGRKIEKKKLINGGGPNLYRLAE